RFTLIFDPKGKLLNKLVLSISTCNARVGFSRLSWMETVLKKIPVESEETTYPSMIWSESNDKISPAVSACAKSSVMVRLLSQVSLQTIGGKAKSSSCTQALNANNEIIVRIKNFKFLIVFILSKIMSFLINQI